MTDQTLAQRAYTTILEHFVEHGRGPHYTELAVALGISTEEARLAQADAVEGSLFRSEETIAGWSQTAPGSEEGILPVRTWAAMFSADLFRRRLDLDYLAKVPGYLGSIVTLLAELDMKGPYFFAPR